MAKPSAPPPPAQRSSQACPPRSRGIPAQEPARITKGTHCMMLVSHLSYIGDPMAVWLKFSCCDRAGEEGQDRRESRGAPAASVTVWKGTSIFKVFAVFLRSLSSAQVGFLLASAAITFASGCCCCRQIRLLSCRRHRGTSSSCTSNSRSLFQ